MNRYYAQKTRSKIERNRGRDALEKEKGVLREEKSALGSESVKYFGTKFESCILGLREYVESYRGKTCCSLSLREVMSLYLQLRITFIGAKHALYFNYMDNLDIKCYAHEIYFFLLMVKFSMYFYPTYIFQLGPPLVDVIDLFYEFV